LYGTIVLVKRTCILHPFGEGRRCRTALLNPAQPKARQKYTQVHKYKNQPSPFCQFIPCCVSCCTASTSLCMEMSYIVLVYACVDNLFLYVFVNVFSQKQACPQQKHIIESNRSDIPAGCGVGQLKGEQMENIQ
jgi:hypothetical protein